MTTTALPTVRPTGFSTALPTTLLTALTTALPTTLTAALPTWFLQRLFQRFFGRLCQWLHSNECDQLVLPEQVSGAPAGVATHAGTVRRQGRLPQGSQGTRSLTAPGWYFSVIIESGIIDAIFSGSIGGIVTWVI